jgi:hypothetical protein
MPQPYEHNFINKGSRGFNKRRHLITARRVGLISRSRLQPSPGQQYSANASHNQPSHDHPSLHQEDDLRDERHLHEVVSGK